MDLLTFVSECLKALAWPVAAIAAVWLLRPGLLDLLGVVHRIKYKDFELHFKEELEEVAQQLEGERGPDRLSPSFAKLEGSALHNPDLAVVEAWAEVEKGLINYAKTQQLDITTPVLGMPLVLSGILLNKDLLTESQHGTIMKLKGLRDRRLRDRGLPVSAEQALLYVEVASRLVGSLSTSNQG